jgi:nodulation protein E
VRRVAITGLGAVSAFGVGVQPFWDGLRAGRSAIREISLVDPARLNATAGAEVPSFDPHEHFTEERLALLDRFAQFTLVAANEALRDAALEPTGLDPDRTGAIVGTGLGASTTLDDEYRRLYQLNGRMHPFTIPKLMYNAAASNLSMTLGLRGPTLAVCTACAAGTHAIGEAAEIIRGGRADVMLAGGADAPFSLGVLKCWEAMRVLAPADDDPSATCRPFSRDRKGLVIGEGAGIAVVEDWARAVTRGARIHGELAGYGATADASHMTKPGVDAPVRAIQRALAQARLAPTDVGYVNAHGTGTRLNDATETVILKTAFGEHAGQLAVSSTKSMHGHAMGASGALELIALVLAVKNGVLPPTANLREPDPECDLDFVPNTARERRVAAGISNSFAFGGLNAVLAVRRVEGGG